MHLVYAIYRLLMPKPAARFGRNWAFPSLASRRSCEDYPVWGALY